MEWVKLKIYLMELTVCTNSIRGFRPISVPLSPSSSQEGALVSHNWRRQELNYLSVESTAVTFIWWLNSIFVDHACHLVGYNCAEVFHHVVVNLSPSNLGNSTWRIWRTCIINKVRSIKIQCILSTYLADLNFEEPTKINM